MINQNEIPEKTVMEVMQDYLNTHVYKENKIQLDRYSNNLPALCLRQVGLLENGKCNILGEYTSNMTFTLHVRIAKEDEPIIAYQFLEKLSSFLNTANANHVYPTFGLHMECQHITLLSNPVFEQLNEDCSEDYKVTFMITINKKPIIG